MKIKFAFHWKIWMIGFGFNRGQDFIGATSETNHVQRDYMLLQIQVLPFSVAFKQTIGGAYQYNPYGEADHSIEGLEDFPEGWDVEEDKEDDEHQQGKYSSGPRQ